MPYAMPNEQVCELLEALTPKLAPGAVVVVERSSRDAEPEWGGELHCFSTRQHGETVLYYVEPDEAEEQAGDESGENTEPGEDAEELAA